MTTNAPKTMTDAPVARPSRPSARFTPLLAPAIMSRTQTTSSTVGSCVPGMSRTKEIACEIGVRPFSSSQPMASTAKTSPTSTWPIILALLRSPRLRCLEILM